MTYTRRPFDPFEAPTSGRTSAAAAFLLIGSILLAGACAAGGPSPEPATPSPAAEGPAPTATDQQPDPALSNPPRPDPAPAGPTLGDRPAPTGVDLGLDTVRAGRFDFGRMWTFDEPPVEYFASTYGFDPTPAWFDRARSAALRIPGCSASFVSPGGLVLTNHHCARDHVSAVTRDGEALLDDGFLAASLEDERPIEGFEADRLIEILDVTTEVEAALDPIADDQARAEARDSVLAAIEERILNERGGEESGHAVEMVSLYNGGRTSAYVFRRYTDVRLVMAPELQIGFFGGDPDNFTYPRYNLDFSFLRVYEDGRPLDSSEHYFPWSVTGAAPGDAVFVIGNPGSTTRLQTVAELLFRRDVADRAVLDFIESRIDVLAAFIEADPVTAERLDLRNELFSLENSRKSFTGVLEGLADPVILAKKRDAEQEFVDAIAADPELQSEFGGLVARLAELQERKRDVAPGFGSFLGLQSPALGGAVMARAVLAFQFVNAQAAGDTEAMEAAREGMAEVPQYPQALDEALIRARIDDLIRSYGADDPAVQSILAGRSPEVASAAVVQGSTLADSASSMAALGQQALDPSDPAIALLGGLIQLLGPFQQVVGPAAAEEERIQSDLGRARYQLHGSRVPPDATFSLRIADGVIEPYPYNGTEAPAFTTFFGLYDRYHSFGRSAHEDDGPWALPERWRAPASGLDLSTPVNFVSTADIIGGNSGSPVVNRDLELVGLAFDGNIESLTGDYIFLTERARTVSVDVRGILEALAEVYGAARLVDEVVAAGVTGRE